MAWLTENCDTTIDWSDLPEIEDQHKIQNRVPLSLWIPHCAAMSFIELSIEAQKLVKDGGQDKDRLAELIMKMQAVASPKVLGYMEAVADELVSENVYSIELREGLDIRKLAGFASLEKEVVEAIQRTENESLSETISRLLDAPEHEVEEGQAEQFEESKRNYQQSLVWARTLMKKVKWGKIENPSTIVSCSYHVGILSVAHHWLRVLYESVNRYLTPVVVKYTLRCSWIEELLFTEEGGLTLAGITQLLEETSAKNLMMKLPEDWGKDNIQSRLEGEFLRAVGRRKLSDFSCACNEKLIASEHSLFGDRPDILTMFQNLGGRPSVYERFASMYLTGLDEQWKNTREFYDYLKQHASEELLGFETAYKENRRPEKRKVPQKLKTEEEKEEWRKRETFGDGLKRYIDNHTSKTSG